MRELTQLIRLVAPRNSTVLIEGETGTGKEVVASAIHRLSSRSAKPLTVLNCAAIPEALLEAELFGHTRGAFTGAVQSRTGRIEAAHGGTLFLDEIGELPTGRSGQASPLPRVRRDPARRRQRDHPRRRPRHRRHASRPRAACRRRRLPARPLSPPRRLSGRGSCAA